MVQKVKVWDGFVRFFHWSLVLLIGVLYYSGEEGLMELHFVAGYGVLSLVIARLFWGVFGSDTAKLKALIHSPKKVIASIKQTSNTRGHRVPRKSLRIGILRSHTATQTAIANSSKVRTYR